MAQMNLNPRRSVLLQCVPMGNVCNVNCMRMLGSRGGLCVRLLHNGVVEMLDCLRVGYPTVSCFLWVHLQPPPPHPLFCCVPLVMSFSRDTILELSMTLVRLSGAKSLQDALVSEVLGEWVRSSPLAKGRWAEATDVGYPSLNRTKKVEAVKQYASFLFAAP